jgi:hypothetical protein
MQRLSIHCAALFLFGLVGAARAQNPAALLKVDAAQNRHPIDPRIYGVAFADAAALSDLNVTLNRQGGNAATRYNWKINAANRAEDWYFESIGSDSPTAGGDGDSFVADSKKAGAEAMLTIPMIDWVAKLGANRKTLYSYSIAKYGAQADHDPYLPDAGNGVAAGKNIAGNDPNDANLPNSPAYEKEWVQHLVDKWKTAQNGGLKYYLLDNEPSIWFGAHRDVAPTGLKMEEYLAKAIDYATMIKSVDPSATVVGPEEWGWSGYLYSGYDQQAGQANGYAHFPDREAHGGADYLPWVLKQFRNHDQATGKRLLDVFSVHYYPQGGEFGDDVSTQMQQLRNRSTRSLWDPNYKDESWIADKVDLIPRLKRWVADNYPGTQIGLTEYNWGADGHINGATAQADVLGILGREGADLATRWVVPATDSPAYNAFKMYRNYDGKRSTFGDVSVSASGPNPDNVAVFASNRSSDGALTVMVVSKYLSGTTPVTLSLSNFDAGDRAEVWQLSSTNAIAKLADAPVNGGSLSMTVPGQSITLFVLPKKTGTPPPSGAPAFVSTATVQPSVAAPGQSVTVTVNITADGPLYDGVVDMEIYDATGARANQQYQANQSFVKNQTKTYAFNWIAGSPGSYIVKAGVFNGDWSENYYWQDSAAKIDVQSSDSATFNFETGAQGWTYSGKNAVVSVSDQKAFLGSRSLAIQFNGPADKQTASVANVTVPANATLVFHIWIPQNSAITAIQPYMLEGEKGGWRWTGNWQPVSSLKAGEWNALTVVAPANVTRPLAGLGVELTTGAAWSGTAYIDSVGWEDGAGTPQKGDLNGDGKLNISDATLLLRLVVGIGTPEAGQKIAGDWNGDGALTISDAVLLLRAIVNA